MLQRASPDPLMSSAGQVRVTAKELASAINALEADKEQMTRLLEGTVPIGQVVRELGLTATPEEIWARIQVQRAEAYAPYGAVRGKRTVWVWLLGVGLAWTLIITALGGGFQQNQSPDEASVVPVVSAPHAPSHSPKVAGTITVSGDGSIMTYDCQHSDLEVSGNGNNLTVTGHCRSLTVGGDGDVVSIMGSVDRVRVTGSGNNVSWNASQEQGSPAVSNEGDGNVLSAP